MMQYIYTSTYYGTFTILGIYLCTELSSLGLRRDLSLRCTQLLIYSINYYELLTYKRYFID